MNLPAFKDVNTLYSLYYFVFKVTNVYLTPSNRTNRQITTYFKGYNYNELFYKWRNPLPWNRVAIIIECPLWTQYRSFYRYVVKYDTPNHISVESHLFWIWDSILMPNILSPKGIGETPTPFIFTHYGFYSDIFVEAVLFSICWL